MSTTKGRDRDSICGRGHLAVGPNQEAVHRAEATISAEVAIQRATAVPTDRTVVAVA